MRRRKRNDEKKGKGGGGGWASTFWKVAGAAAVVAGGIYSILEQMEDKQSGGGWASTFWKVAAATAVVAYSVLKQQEAEQVVVEAGGSSSGGAVWTPPKVGWYKLNVDGSLLRERQSAGCGGVLRKNSGKWIHGFAEKLEYSCSLKEHETEIEGILRGLKWAKEKLGVRKLKLEVESDNEGIVNKVNSGSNSKDHRIHEIRELLRPSIHWKATLAAIDGKLANKVADKLADIASRDLTYFDPIKEFDDPPPSCLPLLAKDSPHVYCVN